MIVRETIFHSAIFLPGYMQFVRRTVTELECQIQSKFVFKAIIHKHDNNHVLIIQTLLTYSLSHTLIYTQTHAHTH